MGFSGFFERKVFPVELYGEREGIKGAVKEKTSFLLSEEIRSRRLFLNE